MKWEEYYPNWIAKKAKITAQKIALSKLEFSKYWKNKNNQLLGYDDYLVLAWPTIFEPYDIWQSSGKNIYNISNSLLQLLDQTELLNTPISAIRLPYKSFYIHLNDSSEDYNGLYVYKRESEELIYFLFVNKKGDLSLNKIFALYAGENSTTIESCIIEMTTDKDYLLFHLPLIVNILLYITATNDVVEKYPELPIHLKNALDKADTKRRKEKAEAAIHQAGYTKVKYVGQRFANMSMGIGGEKSPHWRRGHWHTVLTGPGKQVRELRWFMPTIINHDKGEPTKGHVYEL